MAIAGLGRPTGVASEQKATVPLNRWNVVDVRRTPLGLLAACVAACLYSPAVISSLNVAIDCNSASAFLSTG